MKTCAVCAWSSDAPTCPKCGEASWLSLSTKVESAVPTPAATEPAEALTAPTAPASAEPSDAGQPAEPTEEELEALTAPSAPAPQDSTRRGRRR